MRWARTMSLLALRVAAILRDMTASNLVCSLPIVSSIDKGLMRDRHEVVTFDHRLVVISQQYQTTMLSHEQKDSEMRWRDVFCWEPMHWWQSESYIIHQKLYVITNWVPSQVLLIIISCKPSEFDSWFEMILIEFSQCRISILRIGRLISNNWIERIK